MSPMTTPEKSTQPDEATKEKPPPAPRMSVLSTEGDTGNVTVEVGPEHRKYVLHEAFLTHYSEYFRNAFNRSWKEAEDRTITLDDIEPGTFNVFVDWLYSQKLPASDEEWEMVAEEPDTSEQAILKACAFGDRFLAQDFLQAVNNLYVDIVFLRTHAPIYRNVIYAFNNLRSDIPLLNYLVDSHCAIWKRSCDDTNDVEKAQQSQLPNDFLVRVMYRYSEWRETKKDGKKKNRCSYHLHASDEEREECRLIKV